MTHTHEINIDVTVTITVRDNAPEDAISRVLTDDWRETFYDFRTEGEAYDHLAYNAVGDGGARDASELDGWADLQSGMVTMDVEV